MIKRPSPLPPLPEGAFVLAEVCGFTMGDVLNVMPQGPWRRRPEPEPLVRGDGHADTSFYDNFARDIVIRANCE